MRLLLFVLCVWVFVGVVRQVDAACLDDAVPRGNARPIRFAHVNSPEATLLTSVVAQLLSDTLGITSTLSVADSLAEALNSNLADVVVEYWPKDDVNTVSNDINVEKLDLTHDVKWRTTEEFASGNAVRGSYLGYKDAEQRALLNDTFVLPSARWFSNDAGILEAADIALDVVSLDGDDVYAALVARIQRNPAILFHDRDPSPLSAIDSVKLITVGQPDGAYASPTDTAQKLWRNDVPSQIASFIQNVQFSNADLQSLYQTKFDESSTTTIEEASCAFIKENETKLRGWVPASTTAPVVVPETEGLLWWHYLIIGAGAVLLLLVLGAVLFFVAARRAMRMPDDTELNSDDDVEAKAGKSESSSKAVSTQNGGMDDGTGWRVKYEDIDVGQKIGSGGFGAVYRGRWRGTDVAIKKLFKSDLNEEFAQEVSLMCKLRHPCVILFMGACIEEPNLCIVMEYMPKGSLFEVLQNDDVTLAWDSKMRLAVDIAKGMTYLHECNPPIRHGDLKSLNILVDQAMNAKVSDFGLTRFKSSDGTNNVGSLFWAAPEVIRADGYTEKSDVYSFGIVLYETVARKQPYIDLDVDPLAVASAVVLGRARPSIPDWCPQPVRELMSACWSQLVDDRPPFRDILERLQRIAGDQTLAVAAQESGGGAGDASLHSAVPPPAPRTEVAVVTCDVATTTDLWSTAPTAMRDALVLHNAELRALMPVYGGYEVRGSSDGTVLTAVFSDPVRAAEFCLEAQLQLIDADWPNAVLKLPECGTVLPTSPDDEPASPDVTASGKKKKKKSKKTAALFRGPRARSSIHLGVPEHVRDELTGRIDFMGQVVEYTHKIRRYAHGGQIVVSKAVFDKLETKLAALGQAERAPLVKKLPKAQAKGVPSGESLRYMLPKQLAAREFADGKSPAVLSPGYIVSADDVEFDERDSIGLGSYGEVFLGDYADTPVAVKKLFQQRPKEALLLDFRAELARIAQLAHENLAPFIGGSTTVQHLLIVHEFVPSTLAVLIADTDQEFTWINKLKIALGVAEALEYLHGLRPEQILHHNLKLSNVLLEEDFTPRLADFGFDKIKAICHTMSKSALPGWAPPEVLQGLPYSEKSDIFNCGMLYWQIVTRDSEAFSNVTLRDVLSGASTAGLSIPEDTPEEFVALLKKCWHNKVDKRPSAKKLSRELRAMRDEMIDSSESASDSS